MHPVVICNAQFRSNNRGPIVIILPSPTSNNRITWCDICVNIVFIVASVGLLFERNSICRQRGNDRGGRGIISNQNMHVFTHTELTPRTRNLALVGFVCKEQDQQLIAERQSSELKHTGEQHLTDGSNKDGQIDPIIVDESSSDGMNIFHEDRDSNSDNESDQDPGRVVDWRQAWDHAN